jgi:hypothetical protein
MNSFFKSVLNLDWTLPEQPHIVQQMHILSAAMASSHHKALRKIRLQKQLACFQIWPSWVAKTEEFQLSHGEILERSIAMGTLPK